MLKNNYIEHLENYISGQADDNDSAIVESMFKDGENNYILKQYLQNDWNKIIEDSSTSETDMPYLLDRIHHIIRQNESLKRKKPGQRLFRVYMKAAAILLIPIMLAGGLAYNYLESHMSKGNDKKVSANIYAPPGSRVSFSLPDGTTGMLNSGSQLTYSLPFSDDRLISLKGEAWFEVYKDGKHPFEINTGNSSVVVLGTSFNISAYPTENYVEVVLKEGNVEFIDNATQKKMSILPSERLVSQSGKISKSITDPSKYNAWTEGKLVFREDRMGEVARRIERWYNVKIELVDKELENYSFRATFEDDKLEDVLEFLCMTSPIRYLVTPRILLEDGTYEKEKIRFYLEKL